MNDIETERTTLNECWGCGDPTVESLIIDGKKEFVCDDCSSILEWCHICKKYYLIDEGTCKHLWWIDDWGEFGGCGIDPSRWEDHYEGFFYILSTIEEENQINRPTFIDALEKSLESCKYEIQYGISCTGVEYIDCDLWVKNQRVSYSDLFEKYIKKQDEKTQIGLAWLLSLSSGDTIESDQLTLSWIKKARTNII